MTEKCSNVFTVDANGISFSLSSRPINVTIPRRTIYLIKNGEISFHNLALKYITFHVSERNYYVNIPDTNETGVHVTRARNLIFDINSGRLNVNITLRPEDSGYTIRRIETLFRVYVSGFDGYDISFNEKGEMIKYLRKDEYEFSR